jgi:hypothetical protein
MKCLMVVGIAVMLGTPAVAGGVLDLSVPQTGPFPSFIDLNRGEPSRWDGKPDPAANAVALDGDASTYAPYSAQPVYTPGYGGTYRTQYVPGYVRRDGIYVSGYMRAPRSYGSRRR